MSALSQAPRSMRESCSWEGNTYAKYIFNPHRSWRDGSGSPTGTRIVDKAYAAKRLLDRHDDGSPIEPEGRSPYGERGLKFFETVDEQLGLRRSPYGERGLKSMHTGCIRCRACVALLTESVD